MKKYVLAVLAGVVALTAGCGSGGGIDVQTLPSSSRTTAAASTTESPSIHIDSTTAATLAPDQSLEALLESISEAEESIAAVEESLADWESSLADYEKRLDAMEESVLEAELAVKTTKGADMEVTYDMLMELPDDYLDRDMYFYGRVIQAVAVDDTNMQLLLAINEDNSTRLVGKYTADMVSKGLATGDVISLKGQFIGVLYYRMGAGEVVELPTLQVSMIGIMKEADPLLAQPETGSAETEAPGIQGVFGDPSAPGEVDESAGFQAPAAQGDTAAIGENPEGNGTDSGAEPPASEEAQETGDGE